MQIKNMLTYMKDIAGFRTYFLSDLFARAMQTLEKAANKDFDKLEWFTLKQLRRATEGARMLDPLNLLYLNDLIFDLKYVEEGDLSKTSKKLFDLALGYSMIFKQNEDYFLCIDLLKMAHRNLTYFHEHLFTDPQAIDQDEELCNELFKQKLIQCLAKNLHIEQGGSLTEREKLALEMITRLVWIHDQAKKTIDNVVPLGFNMDEQLKKAIKIFKVIEEGPAFNSFLSKMKFKVILSGSDAKKV